MSAPVSISTPRSAKRLSTSSISSTDSSSSYSSVASSSSSLATSYHSTSSPSSPKTAAKGLYVPVHKRSPSPSASVKALPQENTQPSHPYTHTYTYTIPHLLSLRHLAHEGMKDTLRAGPAPELVMNRKMRKNLEFADSHHRRVSPTSSAGVSPVIGVKALPLPLPATATAVQAQVQTQASVVVAPVIVAPAPAPVQTRRDTKPKTETTQRIPSRSRTRFSGRAPERRRQALGGGLNVASWRNAVPVGVAPSVAFV